MSKYLRSRANHIAQRALDKALFLQMQPQLNAASAAWHEALKTWFYDPAQRAQMLAGMAADYDARRYVEGVTRLGELIDATGEFPAESLKTLLPKEAWEYVFVWVDDHYPPEQLEAMNARIREIRETAERDGYRGTYP